ncbi:DUF1178 family protein [Pseudomonas sp. GX19020]|uniref:DUF1178 family protein n=1 Tax=Pseudomonas sp. GX19020 TaxID=2942277 RepID=UPI002018D9AB|nr:DUF1178 family protein [Pseudomonas sp. GX19020]MCL4066862.1 DUF1178 family protein [Pseudomonas sp. GX19020]
MIRYTLQCEAGHGFESWFADGQAFDNLSRAGHLACPVCGSARVEKALMTPSLGPARKAAATGELPASATPEASPAASPPPSRAEIENALAVLRREVEKNSEYVGVNFASEARRIHDGDAPERSIYGEARPEEARKLLEDGVRVMPLPFLPRRKAN